MISGIMKMIGITTVRRNGGEGNAKEHPDPGRSTDDRDPLLTLRAAFILLSSGIAAAVAGALMYLSTRSMSAAGLTAGSALLVVIPLFNAIVGH
jgi:hypothetical protein